MQRSTPRSNEQGDYYRMRTCNRWRVQHNDALPHSPTATAGAGNPDRRLVGCVGDQNIPGPIDYETYETIQLVGTTNNQTSQENDRQKFKRKIIRRTR